MPPVMNVPYATAMPVGAATAPWSVAGTTPVGTVPAELATQVQELARIQCAVLLQRIYVWLETLTPTAPQLASLIPPTLVAVELYTRRHHQAALAQALVVAQIIGQLVAVSPALPPL